MILNPIIADSKFFSLANLFSFTIPGLLIDFGFDSIIYFLIFFLSYSQSNKTIINSKKNHFSCIIFHVIVGYIADLTGLIIHFYLRGSNPFQLDEWWIFFIILFLFQGFALLVSLNYHKTKYGFNIIIGALLYGIITNPINFISLNPISTKYTAIIPPSFLLVIGIVIIIVFSVKIWDVNRTNYKRIKMNENNTINSEKKNLWDIIVIYVVYAFAFIFLVYFFSVQYNAFIIEN